MLIFHPRPLHSMEPILSKKHERITLSIHIYSPANKYPNEKDQDLESISYFLKGFIRDNDRRK